MLRNVWRLTSSSLFCPGDWGGVLGHLLPPGWVLMAPLGLVVEVGGEESDRDETSGGGRVATEVGASVLGKPLNEV